MAAAERLTRAARSRRSIVAVMFGIVYVAIGLSYLGMQKQITSSPVASMAYRAHLQVMPLDLWGWCFIVAGAVAVVAGAAMWHTVAFTALMAISSWWGLEFFASWLSTGYGRAAIGGLTWILIAGVLLVIVGWPDPRPPQPLSSRSPPHGTRPMMAVAAPAAPVVLMAMSEAAVGALAAIVASLAAAGATAFAAVQSKKTHNVQVDLRVVEFLQTSVVQMGEQLAAARRDLYAQQNETDGERRLRRLMEMRVTELEDSRDRLVRALRAAGLEIPAGITLPTPIPPQPGGTP